MSLVVEKKEWETEILNTNVYGFQFNQSFNNLSLEKKEIIYNKNFPELDDKMLLTTRISTQEHHTRWFLESQQWKCIECYIELKHELTLKNDITNLIEVRDYSSDDLQYLEKIAEDSFSQDRFHIDENIEKNYADNSRKTWLQNACKGRAKRVLVAQVDNKPVGFLLVMEKIKDNKTYGVLDLIAVDKSCRGKHVGVSLVNSFLTFCKENKYCYAMVGTQAHNLVSLRLYEKCGFMINNTSYSFHKAIG